MNNMTKTKNGNTSEGSFRQIIMEIWQFVENWGKLSLFKFSSKKFRSIHLELEGQGNLQKRSDGDDDDDFKILIIWQSAKLYFFLWVMFFSPPFKQTQEV